METYSVFTNNILLTVYFGQNCPYYMYMYVYCYISKEGSPHLMGGVRWSDLFTTGIYLKKEIVLNGMVIKSCYGKIRCDNYFLKGHGE